MKGVDKGVSENFVAIHRRIDQCLPMETMEWCKLEQLLMQITEFAPTSLVYEIGMAAAVYADNQAQRAYMLGRDDGQAKTGKSRAAGKRVKPVKSVKAVKSDKSVA